MITMATTMRTMVQSFSKTTSIRGPMLYAGPWVMANKSSSCIDCLGGSKLNSVQNRRISTFASKWRKINRIDSANFLENRNSLGLCDKMFGNFEKVTPRQVSEKLKVPDIVKQPDYCFRPDGTPSKPISKKPLIKNQEEIDLMWESCRLAKYVLERTLIEPGITTDQLDKYAHELIIKNHAYPSALGYRKFPKSICTSVNNVACHGIPDDRKLISGDVISVDVMVFKNGFHGDCAGTTLVGNVDEAGKTLLCVAEQCTSIGIEACGPDVPFENIGKAIEAHATSKGFSVVPMFTGHGVGRNIHEKPDIYHYDRNEGHKDVMKPGMIFTVEPVITQGMDLVMVLSDGWTAVTVDGARTAQFENSVLITNEGVEILTDCTFVRMF